MPHPQDNRRYVSTLKRRGELLNGALKVMVHDDLVID